MTASSYNAKNHIRHEAIDTHLSYTYEAITDPAFIEAVPEFAKKFAHIFDTMLYVANIRGGVATTPKEYKNDTSIPILGLSQGERVDIATPSILTLHKQQKETLRALLDENHTSAEADETFAFITMEATRPGRSIAITFPEQTLATTTTPDIPFSLRDAETGEESPLRIHFYSRPVVSLLLDEPKTALMAAVGIHELVHVTHALDTITTTPDLSQDRLVRQNEELKAYHVEAVGISALYHHSKNPLFRNNIDIMHTRAFEVEEVRARINKDKADIYEPSDAIHENILNLYDFHIAQ